MFRKIVTILPFQPVALEQLSSYIRKQKKIKFIRLITLLLFLAIFIMQIFILIKPPGASLATNVSDIVYGASSRQEILQAYMNNRDMLGRTDIQDIYNHYGVTQQQITDAQEVTLTQQDDNKYIVTSRNPSNISDSFIKTSLLNNSGIYEFPLGYWGNGSYKALTGMTNLGYRYWILLNGSGSLVFSKSIKNPKLEISKQVTNNPNPLPGQTTSFKITIRNTGNMQAENTHINSLLPAGFEFQSYSSNNNLVFKQEGQNISWKLDNNGSNLAVSKNWLEINVDVRLKPGVITDNASCDSTTVRATNGALVYANDDGQNLCIKPIKLDCPATGTPISNNTASCPVNCPDGSVSDYNKSCALPQVTCESLQFISSQGIYRRTYKTNILRQKTDSPLTITYFINDKPTYSQPLPANTNWHDFSHDYSSPGSYNIRAELSSPNGTNVVQPSQNCSIVDAFQASQDDNPKIVLSQTAKNITKNLSTNSSMPAEPGDTIEYTITAKNIGDTSIENFSFTGENSYNIYDILEYADIANLNEAKLDQAKTSLSWQPQTIKAGESATKNFTVILKNPSPKTLVSESNPLSYNHNISSNYGSAVSLTLRKPIIKIFEQAVANTPSKSAKYIIFVNLIFVVVLVYLYIRSSVLIKQAEYIHKEYSSGGL